MGPHLAREHVLPRRRRHFKDQIGCSLHAGDAALQQVVYGEQGGGREGHRVEWRQDEVDARHQGADCVAASEAVRSAM